MKILFGVLMILGGIALGLYVGIWLMLVGGIMQIVDAVTADPINGSDIAWGVVRIIFASVSGVISAILLIVPGFKLAMSGGENRRSRRLTSTRR